MHPAWRVLLLTNLPAAIFSAERTFGPSPPPPPLLDPTLPLLALALSRTEGCVSKTTPSRKSPSQPPRRPAPPRAAPQDIPRPVPSRPVPRCVYTGEAFIIRTRLINTAQASSASRHCLFGHLISSPRSAAQRSAARELLSQVVQWK